jgi:HEAT repeat protein
MLGNVSVTLPPNPQLAEYYQNWRDTYFRLGGSTRTLKVNRVQIDQTPQELHQSCSQLARTFSHTFNQWLKSPSFTPLRENWLKQLPQNEEVNIIIHTEDPDLQKFPWHLWDLVDESPYAEVVLCSHYSTAPNLDSKSTNKDTVRLLAILGNNEGIDLDADRKYLESIPSLECKFLEKPNRQEISNELSEQHWDILFFAGHSETIGEIGHIYINDSERLSIDELKYGVRNAIAQGLQIAIFNSCDGVGLARQLEELHIPQTVVMREPIPDHIAQEFLKTFLKSFSSHKSFYLSVREARERLQGLESEFPNASWLPVIFQNSTTQPMSWQELRGLPGGIDWPKICETAIKKQLKSTVSNGKTSQNASQGNHIYVPLKLINTHYIQNPQISVDLLPSQDLYSNDEFFQQVLGNENNQPNTKQPKRMAIIGETGSGKQMLLQKMAEWILQKQPNTYPIWISLKDLVDRRWDTLEEYLKNKWLPEAVGAENSTPETFQFLVKLFESGRVWLLLEGLDEMPIFKPQESPLQILVEQLTDWIAPTRVVLSCRSNLWEEESNILQDFEIYRIAGFTYPQQVHQFVDQWFTSSQNLAETLKDKLENPRKEKFRSILQNPMCLKVLCETWQATQGSLPDIKAALYKQFIQAFYHHVGVCEPLEQQKLNLALGNLALETLQKGKYQFQLRKTDVYSQETTNKDLFNQAIDIGLLNLVEKTDGDHQNWLYSFLHPNFQEYLAAIAIENWNFFLNPKQRIYRIFDSQWKEVILLWFGRDNISADDKEAFLDALVKFESDIDLYQYRAYFLAAAGIAEFPTAEKAEGIIRQIVKWCFGEKLEDASIHRFPAAIEIKAKSALPESDRLLAIEILSEALQESTDNSTRSRIAYSLGQIDPGNTQALEVFKQLLRQSEDANSHLAIASSLAEIDKGNRLALTILEKLLEQILANNCSPALIQKVADRLGQLDPDHPKVITTLIDLFCRHDDEKLVQQAANSLAKLSSESTKALDRLLELLETCSHDERCLQLISYGLGEKALGNQRAIAAFQKLLDSSHNPKIRQIAAFNLGKIDPGNPTAIEVLSDLLDRSADDKFRCILAHNLGQLDPGNRKAIDTLDSYIHIASDDNLIRLAAYFLGQIEPGNSDAFETLVQLVRNSQDEATRFLALKNLKVILHGDNFLKTLVALKDEWLRLIAEKNIDSPLGRVYDDLFWLCADRLNYLDFYQAIFGKPPTSANNFYPSQDNYLVEQPSATKETYPLTINILSLKGETNRETIAQALCNKIYAKALPDTKIPTAKNFAELERWILLAKQRLQKPNLAIVLHGCDPQPELLDCCRKIASTDLGLHIAWITEQPLEIPLRGFYPQDPNLEVSLQQWLAELN